MPVHALPSSIVYMFATRESCPEKTTPVLLFETFVISEEVASQLLNQQGHASESCATPFLRMGGACWGSRLAGIACIIFCSSRTAIVLTSFHVRLSFSSFGSLRLFVSIFQPPPPVSPLLQVASRVVAAVVRVAPCCGLCGSEIDHLAGLSPPWWGEDAYVGRGLVAEDGEPSPDLAHFPSSGRRQFSPICPVAPSHYTVMG